MADPSDRRPEAAKESRPPHSEAMAAPKPVSSTPSADVGAHPDGPLPVAPPSPAKPTSHLRRNLLVLGGAAIGLAVAAWFLVPWLILTLNTVSTDDAYVNGHVTFVAPRVAGQVVKVLVDNNNRVRKGDLLVQLDKEPYQIQVDQKKAALATARADLLAAQAQARGGVGLARSNRFRLQHAMEEVDNQIALLRADVAALDTYKAKLAQAKADFDRAKDVAKTPGAISPQEIDKAQATYLVAQAQVTQARETVYQIRVGLGLPAKPEKGDDLTEVPPDLDQNFSSVRQAVGELLQSAAPLGIFPPSYDLNPKQVVEDFYKRDPQGNLDRIYAQILRDAPMVKQAEAKVEQARHDLDQADLNLRYCDVVAEIDGQVTNRNVNPGNGVQVGQNLMVVRSLTEIWIDANFKETQLADLRIGQRVRVEADMYGNRREFAGRITGFTSGTGSTLALLPPENATGNFVKIVQRLPVRIELTDYDPEKVPLFAGASVTPYVYYKEPAAGPDAGKVLQPFAPLPTGAAEPKS